MSQSWSEDSEHVILKNYNTFTRNNLGEAYITFSVIICENMKILFIMQFDEMSVKMAT